MTGALRIVQRNALVYRRAWRGSLFMGFLQPTLFLLAMGVGLGALVDRGGSPLPGGVGFLEFLAPGLLAATCMQTATFESSYPIAAKMSWRRNYEAITATPMRIVDLVLGELTWIAIRLSTVAAAFTLVITAFGVPRSSLVLLAVPAAVLTGLAFSACLIAFAATIRSNENFNVVFRFIITPLFLFSGVFFPLSRLPESLQVVAWFTPLFHGVELVRGLTLGTVESPTWVAHVAFLAGMLAIGIAAAIWTFDRRLRA
jgi:lipooligosaccharide transport system permease protein